MSPIVLYIPHSSRTIPEDVRASFLPSEGAIEHELLIMPDAWTDEIVATFRPEAKRVIFPVSRLVVDPQRFPSDDDEPMAAKGMGAVYTRLSTGEPLRILGEAERRRLMETYYDPHHAKLEDAVAEALRRFGHCLIIDVHSSSSTPVTHEPDQDLQRPEICIGFDQFHSPLESAHYRRVCRKHLFRSDPNRPFSGSIVPQRYWNADARVPSFRIEIRRDMYMEEATGLKRQNFRAISTRLCSLIEELAQLAEAEFRQVT
jgi:N-formylglutamate amidohydrolase